MDSKPGLYKDTVTLAEPFLSYVETTMSKFRALPSDVVLQAYPKCGSTWIKSLAYSILHYDDTLDPLDSAQFIHTEVVTIDYTAITLKHRAPPDRLAWIDAITERPRLYHCHLPYRAMADDIKAKGCKIVYVTRNPKDMIASAGAFLLKSAQHDDEDVGTDVHVGKTSLNEVVEGCAKALVNGMEPYGPFVRHVLDSWEAAKQQSNAPNPILFLQYEQLHSDYEAQVRRLADFLQVEGQEALTDAQVRRVCELNAYQALKRKMLAKDAGQHIDFAPECYFAGGKVGAGKELMTSETAESVDRFVEAALGGSDFRFAV